MLRAQKCYPGGAWAVVELLGHFYDGIHEGTTSHCAQARHGFGIRWNIAGDVDGDDKEGMSKGSLMVTLPR